MRFKTIARYGMAFVLSLTLFSCSIPKNISYYQDVIGGEALTVQPDFICIQPGDKISAIVKSKDPQLSELFNLPVTSYRVGSTTNSSYSQQISCYSVAPDGTIDFPILGKVNVAGKTREEIASDIKERLITQNLIKDPVVTVEFENLHISVLGEVNKPGQFNVDRDQMTVLDAISKAGDLTIYGRRDNVTVLRQENGKQNVYRVNLNNGCELTSSPVYYLQQNDVIYVDPNNVRKRQSTVNGNNVLSTSFWISIASLVTSIAVLLK
jgi:polysaccharide biosynthesis/export protein